MSKNLCNCPDCHYDNCPAGIEHERLVAIAEKMRQHLQRIAYPRRGTDEEHKTLIDFAEAILKDFTRDEICEPITP